MGKLIKEEGEKGRLHIDTPLMGESLVSKDLLARTEAKEYFRMHPDINVLKIGGQSIMDRGAKVLLPILDALVEAKDKHKILLMTGGGTRARHVYNIGVDLGMPTGVLSKLGDKVSWQNAEMLSVLLAKHGGVKIGTATTWNSSPCSAVWDTCPSLTEFPPTDFSNIRRNSVRSPPTAPTAAHSCWRKISAPVR